MLIDDPITGAPRLLVPHRAKRPHTEQTPGCPFCMGAESATPEQTGVIAGETPGSWRARSFPNLYPLTDQHEVIVSCPEHLTSLRDLSPEELLAAVTLWLQRRDAFGDDAAAGDLYRHLFVNDGIAAGASLEHSHAQLLSVPRTSTTDALVQHVCDVESCALCALAPRDDLTIARHGDLQLLAHPAPRMGGSLLLTSAVHDVDSSDAVESIATLLHVALRAATPGPLNLWLVADEPRNAHWYIELLPRTTNIASVELGLGIGVSIIDPTFTAEHARDRIR